MSVIQVIAVLVTLPGAELVLAEWLARVTRR